MEQIWIIGMYNLSYLKVSGPRVQSFCIEKDSHMDGI